MFSQLGKVGVSSHKVGTLQVSSTVIVTGHVEDHYVLVPDVVPNSHGL